MGTALLCSETSATKRLWWALFSPELPIRSSFYLLGTVKSLANTKDIISASLACACHAHLWSTSLQREALPSSHCHCPSPKAQRECQDTPQSTTRCFMELHRLGITLNIYINKSTLGVEGSMQSCFTQHCTGCRQQCQTSCMDFLNTNRTASLFHNRADYLPLIWEYVW